jgi:hypothetical protein
MAIGRLYGGASMNFVKYPKTLALDRLSPHDALYPLPIPLGHCLVVEEKMDGTQLGLSFDAQAQPVLQSRGTVITLETEFAWMKAWVWQHYAALYDCLGQRYVMFGEWLWAKHTLFYDLLPSYWLEFDVYDRQAQQFLSTAARQALLVDLDFLPSVRVIACLQQTSLNDLWQLIGKSTFMSPKSYKKLPENALSHTDTSGLMEGLYLKWENQHYIINRYKLIRPSFIRYIQTQAIHWQKRAIIKNRLENNEGL